MAQKYVRPPTFSENLWTDDPLFRRYQQDRGYTLLIEGDEVTQVAYPYLGDLNSGQYDSVFLGGHITACTDDEAAILVAAGYGAYVSEEPPNG